MRPGAGRPPKAPNERLRHSATARLTDAEYEALCELAGEKPLGVFLRELLLRRIARRKNE